MLHYGLGVVIERYMYTFRPIRLDAKAKKKIFFTTIQQFVYNM